MRTVVLEYKEDVSNTELKDAPLCEGFKVYGEKVFASYGYMVVTID